MRSRVNYRAKATNDLLKKESRTTSISSKDYVNSVLKETDIQKSLIVRLSHMRYKNRPLTKYIYAIPNGGHRSKKTAKTLKEEGVVAGIPDLHFFVPNSKYHSLYIEMKRPKGGVVSKEQKEMIELLRECGHKVIVCNAVDQTIDEILNYLKG